MASKAPPIVRSSKAFSVEIPEGSSSAKSRKSDVVAGLDEGIAPSDPHFETSSMLSEQTIGSEIDSFHDTSVNINVEQLFSQSNPTIADESMSDHHVAIAQDGLQDHRVGVAQDGLQDHVVGIANESLQDHLATLPQENLVDNHASLPDDAIEDRVEAVAEPEAPIPLFVSADDDFPDDHMEIDYPPDIDPNVQVLPDEALVNHIEQVTGDNTPLANINVTSANPVTPVSVTARIASPVKPAVKKSPEILTQEMLKKQADEIIARQQKMEEFHGRVEAIRNTVNNINAKLDQIAPVESKPTSH
jgi:hypothetical protein